MKPVIDETYQYPLPPDWHNQKLNFKNRAVDTPKRVVFCIDHGKSDYGELSTSSICRYASKVHADLHIIRWLPLEDAPSVWRKYDAREYLEKGYQVLIIDNDTVVTAACPDLFYIFNSPHLYTTDQKIICPIDMTVEKGISYASRKLQLPYKPGPIINAGVMLANPAVADLFTWPDVEKLNDLWLFEQDYLTVLVRQDVSRWRPLPAEANMWEVKPGQVPWIVHAAGRVAADKYKYLAQFA